MIKSYITQFCSWELSWAKSLRACVFCSCLTSSPCTMRGCVDCHDHEFLLGLKYCPSLFGLSLPLKRIRFIFSLSSSSHSESWLIQRSPRRYPISPPSHSSCSRAEAARWSHYSEIRPSEIYSISCISGVEIEVSGTRAKEISTIHFTSRPTLRSIAFVDYTWFFTYLFYNICIYNCVCNVFMDHY